MKSNLQPRNVTEKEWVITILGLAILFGVFVRVLPPLLSDFPINDGGMFAVMMRDLRKNNFSLLTFTTYNLSDIPFAYPPLGFYIGAFLQTLGLSELQLLIWVPFIFASFIIPLFYFLAFELTESRPHAALATAFFTLAPGSYVWVLMGGGLTRSLGICFLLLSLYFVHRAYQEKNWKITFLAVIFCSLTVLSHPQAALLAAIGSLIFLLCMKPSLVLWLQACVIALGTILLTSPWWGFVISQHGVDIFLSAGQSGDLRASIPILIKNFFSIQTLLPFGTIFRVLGLFWVLYERRFDLLIWGFALFFIDQRSAPIVTSFLYPILSAFGFINVLPIIINWILKRQWVATQLDQSFFNQRALSMSLLGIIFYLFIECSFHTSVILALKLPEESYQMMTWIKENTFNDSSFLILTGREDVMTDPVQEWFPALAERHSETTLQGLEWTLQGEFIHRWNQLAMLQRCEDLNCINLQANEMNLAFTNLVLDKSKLSVEDFSSMDSFVLFENNRYIVISK